jgi:hypothetical protein
MNADQVHHHLNQRESAKISGQFPVSPGFMAGI